MLLNGATSYMNVLRDTAIPQPAQEQHQRARRASCGARDRFQVGEVTRTDVARQAEASLARRRGTDFFSAQATLQASIASYRQYIGVEPKNLSPAKDRGTLLPKKMGDAVEILRSSTRSPGFAQRRCRDGAGEDRGGGALSDGVGEWPSSAASTSTTSPAPEFRRSVTGQLNVRRSTRAARNTLPSARRRNNSTSRLQVDIQRDTVRAQVVTAWGQLETAKARS